MDVFKNKKRRQSITGLIASSFGIMVVFSIFLHTHELDPSAVDKDCAPCHWSQTSASLEPDSAALSLKFIPITFSNELEVEIFKYNTLKYSYFGLSPPAFF